MQSWGTRSRFDERDTGLEPSKSGVLGLVCAALGRDRSEPIDDLAALEMGVRVDREGILKRDYQTAQNIIRADGKGVQPTAVTQRYYLADAVFLVGLEGDRALLEQIHRALRNPHWSLSLGRKSYLPSQPMYLEDGLREAPLVDALKTYEFLPFKNDATLSDVSKADRPICRFVIQSSEGALRMDEPLAPFSERRFGARYVQTTQG